MVVKIKKQNAQKMRHKKKLKACVHYFSSNFCLSPNDSPNYENVFYFI